MRCNFMGCPTLTWLGASLLILSVALEGAASPPVNQDVVAEQAFGFSIRIEHAIADQPGGVDTIDLVIQSNEVGLGGFDLKFLSSSRHVRIVDVLKGAFLDSCRWEFFNARLGELSGSEYPTPYWHVVGLAQAFPDDSIPRCHGADSSATLARLIVYVDSGFGRGVDTVSAIYFVWEDCTDNTISSESGDTLSFSRKVADYAPVYGFDRADLFPTRLGTPRPCLNKKNRSRIFRASEFHNGRVTLAGAKPAAPAGE